jgi:hypothetical protein
MRWEDEDYVRVYTTDTPTWKLWKWETRTLLLLLLRKVDKAGLRDLGDNDPIEAIAALVELPVEIVEIGLPALLKPGRNGKPATVELRGSLLVIVNYIEAQTATKTDALRKRQERARARATARSYQVLDGQESTAAEPDGPITKPDGEVTKPDGSVTPIEPLSGKSDERPSVLCSAELSSADDSLPRAREAAVALTGIGLRRIFDRVTGHPSASNDVLAADLADRCERHREMAHPERAPEEHAEVLVRSFIARVEAWRAAGQPAPNNLNLEALSRNFSAAIDWAEGKRDVAARGARASPTPVMDAESRKKLRELF